MLKLFELKNDMINGVRDISIFFFLELVLIHRFRRKLTIHCTSTFLVTIDCPFSIDNNLSLSFQCLMYALRYRNFRCIEKLTQNRCF